MPAAAPSRKVGDIEIPQIVRYAQVATTQAQAVKSEAAVAAPVDNPIFKIIVDQESTPEEKREAIGQYLTATDNKTENKARLAQWFQVAGWLEEEFQRSQKEILHLTDTETFSVMQGVYQDMFGALNNFDEAMKPLSDVLDAVYALNAADKTFDAYLEIKGDEEADKKRSETRDKISRQFASVKASMAAINSDTVALGEEKWLFGLGGIKKSARVAIAQNEQRLADATQSLDALAAQLAQLDAQPERESQLGDLAVHKGELKKLLNDVSSDGWRQQQTTLVQTALAFISNSKTKISEVEKHLGKMTEQVDALYDTNTRMNQVYALVGDGVGDAIGATSTQRSTISAPGADESLSDTLRRNERVAVIDDHAKQLEEAQRTCVTGFAETSTEEIRLRTMREANRDKIAKARIMATQGTSGVAGRLAQVVNAVSDAALGESETALRDSLSKMSDRTNVISQKQVIQQSLGSQKIAEDLQHTLSQIGKLREVVDVGRSMMEQGVAAVRDSVESVRSMAEGLGADSAKARAVFSDNQAKR